MLPGIEMDPSGMIGSIRAVGGKPKLLARGAQEAEALKNEVGEVITTKPGLIEAPPYGSKIFF